MITLNSITKVELKAMCLGLLGGSLPTYVSVLGGNAVYNILNMVGRDPIVEPR